MGTRNTADLPPTLLKFHENHVDVQIKTIKETIDFADIVVLCVKGKYAVDALKGYEENLNGKIVIDTTNPIDESNGPSGGSVLNFFTKINESNMELLQKNFPKAKFVKAFNTIGDAVMVNPKFEDGPPTMFICGNDESAKTEVSKILKTFGHDSKDSGPVEAARALE
ncbi:hypothetical protein HK096_009971, partial [Nowakowskiella sp. JEL0078]